MSVGELPLTFAPAAHMPHAAGERAAADIALPSPLLQAPHAPVLERPGSSRASLRAWIVDIFRAAFRPRRATEPCWQWADREGTPVEGGGKYLSRKKPHCRRFMACTTDARVREQHIMKASRAGYTQGVLVRIGHKAVHDPGNVQFTAGAKENSKEVNNARLTPILQHLRVIGRPEDDPDDATSSIIRIRDRNMTVRITGAFTAGAYRTHMVDLCVNDDNEVVTDIPGIGSPADGARSRIRGREGAQLLSISRPTDWATPHHRDVATGTLEFFTVPCPHCGAYQELTIDGRSLVDQLRIEEPLRPGSVPVNPPLAHRTPRLGRLEFADCKLLDGSWDFNRILAETRYRCVSGCIIDQDTPVAPLLAESHATLDYGCNVARDSFSPEVHQLLADGFALTCKQAMVISGRHVAANPWPIPADGGGPRSKRSEHNSDLVSLDFDMTWGHLAKKFAERAHDPASLRNFLNEHGGLPSRVTEGVSTITVEHLADCRAAYERGTIPFAPDLLALGVDSQMGFRKYVVAAARLDSAMKAWRDIAVVDYGYAALRSDILALLGREWSLAAIASVNRLALSPSAESGYRIAHGLVDAGGVEGNAPDVYELSYESGGRLLPSFGRGSEAAQLRPAWWSEIKKPWRGAELTIAFYYDEYWKRHIQHGCIQKIRDIKAVADIRAPGPGESPSETARLSAMDPSTHSLPPRLWLPGLPADNRRVEFEAELLAEQLNEKGNWQTRGHNDFADALKTCFVAFDFRLPFVVIARQQATAAEKQNPAAAN